jgi:hypothetical protein
MIECRAKIVPQPMKRSKLHAPLKLSEWACSSSAAKKLDGRRQRGRKKASPQTINIKLLATTRCHQAEGTGLSSDAFATDCWLSEYVDKPWQAFTLRRITFHQV